MKPYYVFCRLATIILLLSMVTFSSMYAQIQPGELEYIDVKKIQFGATIGYMAPGLLMSGAGFPDTRNALVIGPSVRYRPFEWLSLESGLHYQGKGGTFFDFFNTGSYEIRMRSLTVPLMFNFHRWLSGSRLGYPIVGTYASFTFAGSSTGIREINFGREVGEFRRGEYGLIAGYGIDIEGDRLALKTDVLFNVGLRDLYSDPREGAWAYSFGIGIRFTVFSKVAIDSLF